jgi:ribonuclease R
VHRALEPLLSNPPDKFDRVPDKAHCEEIATHISETERVSASAEEESRRMKMLEYMKNSSEHGDPPVFAGIVTEVRAMGLMVEATEILQRGLVRREGFPKGNWRFEAHRAAYVAGKRELKLGQVLRMEVDTVDLERQFVNFRIVE